MHIRRCLVPLLVLGSVSLLLMRVRLTAQPKPRSIQGVWRTNEVTIARGHTIRPQPSLTIFSDTYYSRTEVHAEQPRTVLADLTKATADELRAVWGPFVGEAGTYELHDDHLITMRPVVAKNPAAMSNGAFSIYSYSLDGNTMTVTAQRNQDGPIIGSETIRLARVE